MKKLLFVAVVMMIAFSCSDNDALSPNTQPPPKEPTSVITPQVACDSRQWKHTILQWGIDLPEGCKLASSSSVTKIIVDPQNGISTFYKEAKFTVTHRLGSASQQPYNLFYRTTPTGTWIALGAVTFTVPKSFVVDKSAPGCFAHADRFYYETFVTRNMQNSNSSQVNVTFSTFNPSSSGHTWYSASPGYSYSICNP